MIIWVEGSWHDLHVSKIVAHFGGLKGLLLKIEAWRCFFNLCMNIILASSINPTATIGAKTQQLEVVEPSVVSSNSTETQRVQREIKWELSQWSCSSYRQKWKGKCSPLKTAMMMNGTVWDQLNILSLCEWSGVLQLVGYFHMIVVCRWVNDYGTGFMNDNTILQLALWSCTVSVWTSQPHYWFQLFKICVRIELYNTKKMYFIKSPFLGIISAQSHCVQTFAYCVPISYYIQ